MTKNILKAYECKICGKTSCDLEAILFDESWFECPTHGIICQKCAVNSMSFMHDATCKECNQEVSPTTINNIEIELDQKELDNILAGHRRCVTALNKVVTKIAENELRDEEIKSAKIKASTQKDILGGMFSE